MSLKELVKAEIYSVGPCTLGEVADYIESQWTGKSADLAADILDVLTLLIRENAVELCDGYEDGVAFDVSH